MVREYTREEKKKILTEYFGKVTERVERYRMFIKFVEIDARALELLIEYSGILDENESAKGE